MLIMTIRTDKPISELGLFNDKNQVDYINWEADRKLAETINIRIKEIIDNNGAELADLKGIVVYKGPGSFTGLRIGISVANALAQGLNIPIVSAGQDNWIEEGLKQLGDGNHYNRVVPEYGALPNITVPKK